MYVRIKSDADGGNATLRADGLYPEKANAKHALENSEMAKIWNNQVACFISFRISSKMIFVSTIQLIYDSWAVDPLSHIKAVSD